MILVGGNYMSVQSKKIMSNIVYYTLVVLAIVNSAFFIYVLMLRDVAMWARVIYIVWSVLVIAAIIFDIICTCMQKNKQISALIIYCLAILALIVSVVVYFVNAGATGLATDFFNIFLSVAGLSLMTTGYMIATWCVGEALSEHASAQDKIDLIEKRKSTRE